MPLDEIRNSFAVPFSYRLIFSDGVLGAENETLAELCVAAGPRARAAVFIDRGLARANPAVVTKVASYFHAHRDRLVLADEPLVVAGGEDAKQGLELFEQCASALHAARIDRHSYAIMIGGGAMLDAVGFAASSVHRGVRQIRIPTTVLSQNDAGIGVKNGIDYLGTKNFLGAFYPPYAVINDFSLLATLPPGAWRSGTAEAVKVALIRDPAFFAWIESHADDLARHEEGAMRHMIHRCAELHLQHIATSGDPFERGSARPLDFGHWSAHKLEQLSGFAIGHGHVVAVGMAIDVRYAAGSGLLDPAVAERVIDCLVRLGFRLDIGDVAAISRAGDLDGLLQGIQDFQEHLGGKLSLTMLTGIGTSAEIERLDMPLMKQCAGRLLGCPGSELAHTGVASLMGSVPGG